MNPERNTELLMLNDDCILKLFEYLDLHDAINLWATCSRLRSFTHSIYNKYTKLDISNGQIVSYTDKNGVHKMRDEKQDKDTSVGHILPHIGQYVLSVTINFRVDDMDTHQPNNSFKNIISICFFYCKKVKSIRLLNLNMPLCTPDFNCFGNVEMLTLHFCKMNSWQGFLKSFRKLKVLNLFICANFKVDDLKTLFQNNCDIEKLVVFLMHFPDFHLLKLLPKLEAFYIDIDRFTSFSDMKSLLRIAKLRIYFNGDNVNEFLRDLAVKGKVTELDLQYVDFNKEFFNILRTFEKLQLLVLKTSYNEQLISKHSWPSNLKHLKLEGHPEGSLAFTISFEVLISTIKQLRDLRNLILHDCDIVDDDAASFDDITTLSQQITKAMDLGGNNHKLSVVLPSQCGKGGNGNQKYSIESVRLRIWNNSFNGEKPSGIDIYFPDLDD